LISDISKRFTGLKNMCGGSMSGADHKRIEYIGNTREWSRFFVLGKILRIHYSKKINEKMIDKSKLLM